MFRYLLPTLAAFMLVYGQVYTQDLGSLKANISPPHAIMSVDGKIFNQQEARKIQLPSGTHEIRIWADEFSVFVDTVNISSGQTTEYSKGLNRLSSAFEAYREEMRQYRVARTRRGIGAALLIGISSGATYAALTVKEQEIDEYIRLAENANAIIENSISQEPIDAATVDYNAAKANYDRAIKVRNTWIPVAAVCWAGTAYYLVRLMTREKTPKPTYTPLNPITGEQIGKLGKRDLPQLIPSAARSGIGISMTF